MEAYHSKDGKLSDDVLLELTTSADAFKACLGRLMATDAAPILRNWMIAEGERGTDPGDMIYALINFSGSVMGSLIQFALVEEGHDDVIATIQTTIAESLRRTIASAALREARAA